MLLCFKTTMALNLLSAARTHLPKLVFPSTHRLFAGPARSFCSSGGGNNTYGNKTLLPGQPFVPAGTGSSYPASGDVNRSGVSSRVKAVIGSSFSASSANGGAYLAGLTNRRFFSTIRASPSGTTPGTQMMDGALNSDDKGGASSGETKASANSQTKDAELSAGTQMMDGALNSDDKGSASSREAKASATTQTKDAELSGEFEMYIDWDSCEEDPEKASTNVAKRFTKGISGVILKFAKFTDEGPEFTAQLAEHFDGKELAKMIFWHPFQVMGEVPAYEAFVQDDNWRVRVDMPGIGADDVKLNFKDNTLYIRGEEKPNGDAAAARVYSGKLDMPDGQYLTNNFSVTAKDGVIRISVPKVKV
ncbi:hypothetical protein Tsubulata_016667 [Turnera subulata]|uniref:SHSP domain-containing protein n=1 Tax=Turnera subulata TaxID=218843 RepID=A0A9Q0FSX9_9ROSI|nr:hypothetical protein Tsubulata_016667 [Turnera subulata]